MKFIDRQRMYFNLNKLLYIYKTNSYQENVKIRGNMAQLLKRKPKK